MKMQKTKLKVKALLIKKIPKIAPMIIDKAGEQTMHVSLDEDSVYSSFLAETGSGTTVTESPESNALVELNCYLNDGLIPMHEDPMRWWYTNRRDFPWLSLVALNTFANCPLKKLECCCSSTVMKNIVSNK